MSSAIYKVVEIVGSSPDSIDAAIRNAIDRASKTIHHIGWFEVVADARPCRGRCQSPISRSR